MTHAVLCWQGCSKAASKLGSATAGNKVLLAIPLSWKSSKHAADAGHRRHPAQRGGHPAHAAAAGPGGLAARVRPVRWGSTRSGHRPLPCMVLHAGSEQGLLLVIPHPCCQRCGDMLAWCQVRKRITRAGSLWHGAADDQGPESMRACSSARGGLLIVRFAAAQRAAGCGCTSPAGA